MLTQDDFQCSNFACVFDDFLSCGPDHRHRHARQVVPNREPALKVPAAPGNFHWASPLDAHVREDYVHGTEEVSAMVYSSTGPMRGIGGVFGVAECGTVFFNTAVPGSACWEAMEKEKLRHGDVLFSVDGLTLYRAPLKVVAAKLLGPEGSFVNVVFRRGPAAISLDFERRQTNVAAAQSVLSTIVSNGKKPLVYGCRESSAERQKAFTSPMANSQKNSSLPAKPSALSHKDSDSPFSDDLRFGSHSRPEIVPGLDFSKLRAESSPRLNQRPSSSANDPGQAKEKKMFSQMPKIPCGPGQASYDFYPGISNQSNSQTSSPPSKHSEPASLRQAYSNSWTFDTANSRTDSFIGNHRSLGL